MNKVRITVGPAIIEFLTEVDAQAYIAAHGLTGVSVEAFFDPTAVPEVV